MLSRASLAKYSFAGRPFTRIWPVPSLTLTLAMAVLRFPVTEVSVGVSISVKLELLGLLGRVRMNGPRVDLEFGHLPPQRVL
jgi:hypothetical protein